VAEAGGRCCICGYDRYLGALQFHHLDPDEKRLGLATGGLTLSLATLRHEARKCVLLCAAMARSRPVSPCFPLQFSRLAESRET
jgi:hypothetical protein